MRKRTTRVLTLLLALALCLGLLPTAALAEESNPGAGPFSVTFNANGGVFSDGTAYTTTPTTDGPSEHEKCIVQFPKEEPKREGYYFIGWAMEGAPDEPAPQYVTADAVMVAMWDEHPNSLRLILDPNGGDLPAGADKIVYLDESNVLRQELPVPTRGGYSFLGWYQRGAFAPVKAGDKFSDYQTPLTAKWAKIRTSKVTPSLTASPAKIEAGAEKVELVLSCATSGVSLDWRPLERALYMGGEPSDWEAAAKSLISGNFSGVGLKLTKVFYQDAKGDYSDGAYPYELYPEGVCPASELVLTLEGKATAGTLSIQLGGENFLEFVPAGSGTVLDASSADIFSAAQVKIPIGSGNPEGPFTVKFDLNCKDPKESEIPKEQKISKGQTVDLPDGKKLTAPSDNLEFYAWCMKGTDGKLYPWKESTAVTAGMTLYAGWVRKGTVVKDGEALPVATEPSKPTQNPEVTVITDFHDVPANSPFLDSIVWAVKQGITNGKTATSFGPGDPCTRAQIVTFLWRAAGSPEPKLTETQYMDVTDPAAYYYKAVQWAAELDMEYSGTFDPHKTCDRASAVYFIWKAFGSPKAAAKANFADMPEEPKTGGQWYWPDLLDAVDWAVSQGVTTGKTADTFAPDDPCTRGQIVTFLYRAYVK